jgi:hypothetical protein
MKRREVEDYLRSTRDVEGWFFPIDAYLFALVDRIQNDEGISGNLFEIGVHHGKTAIFLGRAAAGDEIVGVCDVFGEQQLNVDHSGEGSLALFAGNMLRLGNIAENRVRIFARRSDTLTAVETTSSCRFFHIDGGHRPEDVYADLRTADAALRPDGVVAVDDVFNASWPGVSEGFYQFMDEHPRAFAPIVIGGNKAFLTRPAAVQTYERHWSQGGPPDDLLQSAAYRFERKEWLGEKVMTAVPRTWVDLDPAGAAGVHLGSAVWKRRLFRLMFG